SRKPLPRCTRAKEFYNTTKQVSSHLRDAGGGKRRHRTFTPNMSDRHKEDHCDRNQAEGNTCRARDGAGKQWNGPCKRKDTDIILAKSTGPARGHDEGELRSENCQIIIQNVRRTEQSCNN